MKYKVLILLVVLCLVFVGCDAAQNSADPTTATPTEAPTQAPTEGAEPDFTFPEEMQGIELPEYEFTDEDLAGSEVVPVTEPPATEAEGDEPEETEAPTTPYIPSDDPDVLPEDILDDDE